MHKYNYILNIHVQCDTYAEFMNVLNFIKSTLDTDEIKFTELAMTD